ncbi:dioxygenase [Brevibacillus humidisoli]|uniref:dioxygenase family protein n=1 Tax=Brevibacillus humidisoli TaxID=2895522 RepID=UPI001E5120D0|nr:class III extradiol ring-cleavage dioxygenase [Brevibacillus humidisoli]UFJ40848.1 dioxygenase [Brevibacillus humidisoli]
MMPTLFISHGAPSLAMERNAYTDFLQDLGMHIGKPDAIVLFSAHWESDLLSFTYTDQTYETIYDFYGFPDQLYQMTYPAQGSTQVASLVEKQFAAQGIPTVRDEQRGLDHGAWVILHHLFPQAEIPVVAVSINPGLPPQEQYKIGQALGSLGQQNILVIGSGAVTHNLRLLDWSAAEPVDWAVAFDDWIVDHVQTWDLDSLFAYRDLAPYARQAVPRNEHFDPLFIAMGAADERQQAQLLHRSYQYGSLSMIAFRFG